MKGKNVVQLRPVVRDEEKNITKADCIAALRLLLNDLEAEESENRDFGLSIGVVVIKRNEDGSYVLTGYDDNAGVCQTDPRNALFVAEQMRSKIFSSGVREED